LLNPQQTKKLGARVLPQMCDLCIMLQKLMPATSILLLLIAVQACAQPKLPDTGCKAPSHDTWSTLLRKHVSAEGHVAYADLLKDSTALNAYLKVLATCPPAASWSRNERLAYWINAYNAFTVQFILRHYPVKSIKDIGPKLAIPLVNSVWDVKFFTIAGVSMSLNQIEHDVLRKEFNEPRIHFAIVCASYSCPRLLNTAYTAAEVDNQLTLQAFDFINDPKRNSISKDKLQLSSIFSWFKGDFTANGTLIDFIRKYSKTPFSPKAKVSYLDYDWNLNGH
jgi:hypothetical protein